MTFLILDITYALHESGGKQKHCQTKLEESKTIVLVPLENVPKLSFSTRKKCKSQCFKNLTTSLHMLLESPLIVGQ